MCTSHETSATRLVPSNTGVLVVLEQVLGSFAVQDLLSECSEVAAALKLRMPLAVSTRVSETASVYAQLVQAARDPQHSTPLTPSLEVRSHVAGLQHSDIIHFQTSGCC